MTNALTLDDIRRVADAKYGSTAIDLGNGETLHLKNPLRLPKLKRDQLTEIQKGLGDENLDQMQILCDVIVLISDDTSKAHRLLALVGEDLAVLTEIFNHYVEGTQLGEASASDD